MKDFKILCFKSEAREFQRNSSEYIARIPADPQDQFALVMAVGRNGAIGFDKSPESVRALNEILSKCYSLCVNNSIQIPELPENMFMPSLLFRDKSGRFEALMTAHKNYEAELKKYKILSRHRDAQEPSASVLSTLLQDDQLLINEMVYRALQNACHYVISPILSGEHGRGAFNVFAKNLDFFFEEFNSVVSGSPGITFVHESELLFD